jgi:hypothetical protein
MKAIGSPRRVAPRARGGGWYAGVGASAVDRRWIGARLGAIHFLLEAEKQRFIQGMQRSLENSLAR